MRTFINSSSVISPQKTFDLSCRSEGWMPYSGNRLTCVEPDYSRLIDPKAIRRMSRIIKMGVAASKQAVDSAGIVIPDAIIVGTAFGCLEDTNQFLSRMVEYKEDMLNPTPFIHSTHNTIASQIAIHFKCYGYNSTYVHRSVSFESALADAALQLADEPEKNVLVGGTDEIIDTSFTIMDRLGFYRDPSQASIASLFEPGSRGTLAGEGAAYFVLSGKKNEKSVAEIKFVETISFAPAGDVADAIKQLLQRSAIQQPDLVIAGFNGDAINDHQTNDILQRIGNSLNTVSYKQYCGDYPTSTAFALWYATEILNGNHISGKSKTENILIYNQTANTHHSFILVSAC